MQQLVQKSASLLRYAYIVTLCVHCYVMRTLSAVLFVTFFIILSVSEPVM